MLRVAARSLAAAVVGCFTSCSVAPTFSNGARHCCRSHIVASNSLLCRPAHPAARHGDCAQYMRSKMWFCVFHPSYERRLGK
jgi:hypothetical protein